MKSVLIMLGVILMPILASGQDRGEIRIDTFDKRSNRTGYVIVNPQSGRVDQFDTKSNRLGYGTITPAPQQPTGQQRGGSQLGTGTTRGMR